MRLAGMMLAVLLAAPAPAANAHKASSGPAAVAGEGLAYCKTMFADRHPLPPDYKKSVDYTRPMDEVAREFLKQAGLKPPIVDELKAAGWTPPSSGGPQAPSVSASKGGSWGEISFSAIQSNCLLSSEADNGIAFAPEFVAAVEKWIAQTYPAAVRDKPETRPWKDRSGRQSMLTRTLWNTSDRMRFSLMLEHVGKDTKPVSITLRIEYSP